MISRLSVFLLVGLFAAATLQTAGAQNPGDAQDRSDQHTVTINVNNIDAIDVDGSPTITVDTLNAWVADQSAAGKIDEITSNASGSATPRKVEVSITSNTGDLENIGLKVDPDVTNSGFGGGSLNTPAGEYIKLLDVGSTDLNTKNVYTDFSNVHNEEINLTYEARANASYDPSVSTDLTVEYTLTTN